MSVLLMISLEKGSLQDYTTFLADEDTLSADRWTKITGKLKRWARSLYINIKRRRVQQRVTDDGKKILIRK